MARVVDVPGAFAARGYPSWLRGRITIGVADDTCPWVDGTWTVEVRGFNVPQGPQSFSICASPDLADGGPCIVPDVLILGELSLDGGIQSARGVLPIAVTARRQRFSGLLLPVSNTQEAAVVDGLQVFPELGPPTHSLRIERLFPEATG